MAPLLCRSCMWHSHTNNPLHWIQCWTGNHFREACLWEVGIFILVPHSDESHLCPTLTWQLNMLETLQRSKDRAEAMESPSVKETPGTGCDNDDATQEYWPDGISAEQLAAEDVWFTQQLDLIYEQGANPDMLEEDEEENDDADADVTPNATFAWSQTSSIGRRIFCRINPLGTHSTTSMFGSYIRMACITLGWWAAVVKEVTDFL